MSFLSLIAWLSVCLLAAGLLPKHGVALNSVWVFAGLFGLVSAVGLSQAVKSEIVTQQALLDNYIAEARTDPLTGVANRRAFDAELEQLAEEFNDDPETLERLRKVLDEAQRKLDADKSDQTDSEDQ